MANQAKFDKTTFSVGDVVEVNHKISEEGGQRSASFQGMVISIKGRGEGKTFTVRRIGAGKIGIERIFPLASPMLTKIEVLKKGKVRRAKLYYLRKR